MDAALWESPTPHGLTTGRPCSRVATLPFDHTRRAASALVDDAVTAGCWWSRVHPSR